MTLGVGANPATPEQARQIADEIGAAYGGDAYGNAPGDVFGVADSAGNLAFRIDSRGAAYTAGQRQPIESVAGGTVGRHVPFLKDPRDSLATAVRPYVDDLIADGRPFIHPPSLLVPNGYGVPDGWINEVQITTAGRPRVLKTPYADGGLVHPYLIEMRRPLLGYKYLMTDTPHKYGNSQEENAVLYGSNDLESFDLIPDVVQPLGFSPGAPGYNSDANFSYDPRDGSLILGWRPYEAPTAGYVFRKTWNGVDWSEPTFTPSGATGTGLSPSILFDPVAEVWRLWAVTSRGVLSHFTGPEHNGPWTLVGSQLLHLLGIKIWHHEVKYMGNKFVLLAEQNQVDGDQSQLWFGVSENGTTWTMGSPVFVPPRDNIYKASFLPQFDGNNMRMQIAWDYYAFPAPPEMTWTFQCEPTNWIDFGVL
jgi:hypothetical protein